MTDTTRTAGQDVTRALLAVIEREGGRFGPYEAKGVAVFVPLDLLRAWRDAQSAAPLVVERAASRRGCAAWVIRDCRGHSHPPRPCSRSALHSGNFCGTHERTYRVHGTGPTIDRPGKPAVTLLP